MYTWVAKHTHIQGFQVNIDENNYDWGQKKLNGCFEILGWWIVSKHVKA